MWKIKECSSVSISLLLFVSIEKAHLSANLYTLYSDCVLLFSDKKKGKKGHCIMHILCCRLLIQEPAPGFTVQLPGSIYQLLQSFQFNTHKHTNASIFYYFLLLFFAFVICKPIICFLLFQNLFHYFLLSSCLKKMHRK